MADFNKRRGLEECGERWVVLLRREQRFVQRGHESRLPPPCVTRLAGDWGRPAPIVLILVLTLTLTFVFDFDF
jgi:hypothetical protein